MILKVSRSGTIEPSSLILFLVDDRGRETRYQTEFILPTPPSPAFMSAEFAVAFGTCILLITSINPLLYLFEIEYSDTHAGKEMSNLNHLRFIIPNTYPPRNIPYSLIEYWSLYFSPALL